MTQVLEKLTAEICQELLKLTGRKQKPQSKYSDEDKYMIVKYDKDNGASQAAKFSKNKYPTINESTVHCANICQGVLQKHESSKSLCLIMW